MSVVNATAVVSMQCTDLPTADEDKMDTLRFVHFVFASLSILGAGSIIVYSTYKGTCRSIEVRPLFHLSIADLCLSICWVAGAVIWSLDDVGSSDDCVYLQAVTEAFHIMTFFLTVNYALNVYVRIKDRMNRSNNLRPLLETKGMIWALRVVLIISWFLPWFLMIPVFILYEQGNSSDSSICLLLFRRPATIVDHDNEAHTWLWCYYGSIIFVSSLLLSITALLILYGLAYRIYRNVLSQNVWTERQRMAVSNMRHRITLYILVFLFCWLPALTIAIDQLLRNDCDCENTHPSECLKIQEYFVLYLVLGITAPSQGFLNALVYGWTRPSFRTAASGTHADTGGGTTPLMKTTYRSYGVASGRKTFSRSGSTSPAITPRESATATPTLSYKGSPSPYSSTSKGTPSPHTTGSKETPSPYPASSKGTHSPYSLYGTPSPYPPPGTPSPYPPLHETPSPSATNMSSR